MKINIDRLELAVSDPGIDPAALALDVGRQLGTQLARSGGELGPGPIGDFARRLPSSSSAAEIGQAIGLHITEASKGGI